MKLDVCTLRIGPDPEALEVWKAKINPDDALHQGNYPARLKIDWQPINPYSDDCDPFSRWVDQCCDCEVRIEPTAWGTLSIGQTADLSRPQRVPAISEYVNWNNLQDFVDWELSKLLVAPPYSIPFDPKHLKELPEWFHLSTDEDDIQATLNAIGQKPSNPDDAPPCLLTHQRDGDFTDVWAAHSGVPLSDSIVTRLL